MLKVNYSLTYLEVLLRFHFVAVPLFDSIKLVSCGTKKLRHFIWSVWISAKNKWKNLNEDNQQPTQFPYYPPQTFPPTSAYYLEKVDLWKMGVVTGSVVKLQVPTSQRDNINTIANEPANVKSKSFPWYLPGKSKIGPVSQQLLCQRSLLTPKSWVGTN